MLRGLWQTNSPRRKAASGPSVDPRRLPPSPTQRDLVLSSLSENLPFPRRGRRSGRGSKLSKHSSLFLCIDQNASVPAKRQTFPLFSFLPLAFLAPFTPTPVALSPSLSGVGSHRIRVAFWLFLPPLHSGHFSSLFSPCNLTGETNAHWFSLRTPRLREIRTRHLARAPLSLSAHSKQRGQKCRSASTADAAWARVRSFRPCHRETQREQSRSKGSQ